MEQKPAFVGVMGSFFNLATSRNWQNLERFFNPGGVFREVHLISMGDDRPYDRTRFGTVIVHSIPTFTAAPRLRIINNLVTMARARRLLRRMLEENDIDLVAQIYGGPLKFGLPAVLAAKRAGLPSVISLHNDYPRLMAWTYSRPLRWLSGFAWRYLFRNCTQVRSVSRYIAEFAVRSGVSVDRVHVIPNKEDLEKFQTPPIDDELKQTAAAYRIDDLPQDAVVYLTVGRLVPAKNFAGMIEAFAEVAKSRPNLYYLIVGDGPLAPALRQLARRLGVGDCVRFLGFVPHDSLRCVYHLSDVFLFATHYEGQPRVLVEALLAGLPVICSNYGQVCEVVSHERDGLWTDPRYPGSIAEAIRRLANDSRLRQRLSEHSEFDAARYSVERVGEEESKFYLSILRRPEPPLRLVAGSEG